MFRRGKALFQEGVARIRSDGNEGFFANGTKPGLELKYQNFVYGLLIVAAHVLQANGVDAYNYKVRGGASLKEALVLHLDASLNPGQRTNIQQRQATLYLDQRRSHGDGSLSYLEFAIADGVFVAHDRLLKVVSRIRTGSGFYSGYHGGYTSCLFGVSR